MAKQTINIGTVANDGTGDPLRSAFDKANDNFTELYGAGALSIVSDILTYTKADGTTSTVDLTPYLDEDARAISSGTLNGATGIVTFTRDDATTFTLDLSALLDDTNLVTSVNSQTGAVVLDTDDVAEGTTNLYDKTVSLAGGTGVSTSGTYPSFTISSNDSQIIHDNLSGFVANEHIDHTSVTLTAGNGLTGGGDISANRTFNVVGGDGITANTDEIEVSVDDSTIELSASDGTGVVRIKDDGVTYAKMGAEFTTAASISASDVDFSSAAVFTKTLSANTTLTFSNVQTGMVKDLVITGNFTLTLPASVKTITGTYDGTVSNLIQIVSTNGSTEQWATISQEA